MPRRVIKNSAPIIGSKERTVGAILKLPWKNNTTGKTTIAQEKILAIGDDEKKLDRMIVDDEAEFHDPNDKIFDASVISQKKTLASNERMIQNIVKSNKRRTDEKISKDSGIFHKSMCDGLKQKRGRNAGNSTITSGIYDQMETLGQRFNKQNFAQEPVKYCGYFKPNSSEMHSWLGSNNVDKSPTQSFYVEPPADFAAYQAWRRMNALENSQIQKPPAQMPSLIFQTVNHESIVDNTTLTHPPQGPPTSPHTFRLINSRNTSESPLQAEYCNRFSDDSGSDFRVIDSSSLGPKDKRDSENRSSDENTGESRCTSPEFANLSESDYPSGHPDSVMIRERDSESDDGCISSVEEVETRDHEAPDACAENNINIVGKALAGIFPVKITKELIWLQSVILSTLRFAYEDDCKNDQDVLKNFEIPQSFLQNGQNKVEIASGSKFYLPCISMDAIQRKLKDTDKEKWKVVVRETLIHVYGKKMGSFSAKGAKVNSRPPINRQLFRGLLAWIQTVSEEPIDEKIVVKYINKLAYNKRRTSKVTTIVQKPEQKKKIAKMKEKMSKGFGSLSAKDILESQPPVKKMGSFAPSVHQSSPINGRQNFENLSSPSIDSSGTNENLPIPVQANPNVESLHHTSFMNSAFHYAGLDSDYGTELSHMIQYSGRTEAFPESGSGPAYAQL